MPVTKPQRSAMAVALHSPSKLYKKNRPMLSMGKEKLREMIHSGLKSKKRK